LLKSIHEDAGIDTLESMLDALDPCELTTGGCTGVPVRRLGEVAQFLLGTTEPRLAGLYGLLDRVTELRDDLALDSDDPMRVPMLRPIAEHPLEQLHQARDLIEQTVDSDHPAARVVAALVLGMVDREAGQRALCRLATDRTELRVRQPESAVYMTVGEVVRGFIDSDIETTLPPPPRLDPTLVSPPTRWQRLWSWLTSLD
jgi:hypothetical protein